ncbi:MAG: hypothetical protein V3V22_01785 [Methylococcales bacterium]
MSQINIAHTRFGGTQILFKDLIYNTEAVIEQIKAMLPLELHECLEGKCSTVRKFIDADLYRCRDSQGVHKD